MQYCAGWQSSWQSSVCIHSAFAVLVVAAPPDARLVAPLWGAVEPRVHAPDGVQSARIGGVGVIRDAVLERERAHAGPLARVRGHIGSGHDRVVADRVPGHAGREPLVVALLPGGLAPIVVFDAFALLLLAKRNAEVEVEFAADRRRPGERPAHPPLVRLQLRERRPRHRRKRDVVIRQVHDEAVEPVGDRRAGCTPRRVVGPEHVVIDEELRASLEEFRQRGAPFVGLESVLLVDADPRQLLPSPRQLVAAPRVLLLRLEQLEPRCEPIFTCPGHVLRHRSSLLRSSVFRRSFLDTTRWLLVVRYSKRRVSNDGSYKCDGIPMDSKQACTGIKAAANGDGDYTGRGGLLLRTFSSGITCLPVSGTDRGRACIIA